MPLERRQPLPAGRYWIDVVGKANDAIFSGWALGFRNFVHFEADELTPELSSPPPLPPVRPQVHWYLFTTSQPLVWLGPALGFPTIATPDVKTHADTTQRPPTPPGLFDNFSFDGAGSTVLLALLAYFAFAKKK